MTILKKNISQDGFFKWSTIVCIVWETYLRENVVFL